MLLDCGSSNIMISISMGVLAILDLSQYVIVVMLVTSDPTGKWSLSFVHSFIHLPHPHIVNLNLTIPSQPY